MLDLINTELSKVYKDDCDDTIEAVVEKHLPRRVSVAVRSNTWAYSRSLAGIAGSNPAEGMDVSPV